MIPDSIKTKSLTIENWTVIQEGNYIEYAYYSGTEAGNPSGNANLKEIKYFEKDGTLKYHILFTWNADDKIIKEESLTV